MTACAPNTYHRPHFDRTTVSARSSSTAAGVTGTSKTPCEAYVGQQILAAVVCAGPVGIEKKCLTSELVGDAQPFGRPELRDARGPVLVLGAAHPLPVTRDELLDVASDHWRHFTSAVRRAVRDQYQ